ncbi:BspA family leucine-rich repeat surface protein [Lactobacillus sp. W8093]|uniref:BspA family leucine-rich repeat surface protein n=1 Tax=Lactobacillus sp. W8093 TaxID=2751038 RepID=UPI0018EFF236|nr:BspA family leucine-rich repeat surface protein [Lactobacillus sp. W8093]MBI0111060.1 BspA family leucine-rich repeat surface protein [Lactobacillus sp. W8093]MCT6827865.1 BspA family leucine-rich repeat surface protein [Lactobacillus helsingborgensis]
MNTHKNANKQGEKILLGGVAAAALGLINAKPQTVKAANQNGNRATKKAASRAVKTKLTYQNETDTETEGETATNDDPAGQNSGSQTAGSENNAGTASSNPAGGSNQDAAAGNTSAPSTTDNAKTEKLGEAVKRDNENPTILTGVWLGVDVTYQPGLGIFTVKGNNQTINTVNDRSTSIIQAKKSRDLLADPLIVDRNQVREVRFEGPLTINGTVQSMFDTLPNLTTITGLENLNTSNVYSMYGMFANCSSLRSVEGINKLDASKVTDMSYMFENCFKNPKDLISLDLSGLNIGLNINKNDTITMKEMFRGCSKLKSIILPDKIDTSQVTDMTGMFYGCSNLVSVSYPSSDNPEDPANQKVDLSKFNTNSLQYMDYMFSGCTDLTALNIASFDMSKAIKTNGIKNALNNLPNLRKLVLGKNCKFYRNDTNTNVGLDTPGTWVNVGTGTEKNPQMSKKWSSTDLMNNYNGDTDHDTYIRFYDGYPVNIHYVYLDKEGKRQPIFDKDGKSYDYVVAGDKGKTSDPINTRNIYGYTINSIFVNNDKQSSTDKATVTFTDQEQDVYFVYDRATGKPITVNYLYFVDEKGDTKPILDKDNKPMTEKVDGVLYGDQKDIIPKPIPGYTIKQINIDYVKQPGTDKATVGYSDKDQIVDFIYTKNPVNNENKVKAADVTVHYKDEFGNTIAPDEILSGYVGDGYTTGAKNISGYTLKTRPDNATGFFSTFPQDVTYIYTKIGTNNTPNINEPNTPTKIPKQNKKRKEKKNPTKQTASRNLSKKQGISSVAKSKKAAALPQTGTNKHSSLALLALGSLTLVGALGAAWFSRKKIK